jgi:hypothetical protein
MSELTAHMRLVIGRRDALPTDRPLQLALLVSPPSPEGWNGRELAADGYVRLDANFEDSRPDASKTRNTNVVKWSFRGTWPATHLALIDENEQTIAYGALEGPTPFVGEISFRPGRIELRR